MSETRLVEALKAEVAETIAVIEREADESVSAIEQETVAMAAEIRKHLEAETDQRFREFRQERNALFEKEQRDHHRILQYRLVDSVFVEIDKTLSSLRQHPEYPEIWKRLYEDALAVYEKEEESTPLLQLHPEDASLAESYGIPQSRLGPNALVQSGVILVQPEGRFRMVNTPASRLDRGREEFVKQITEALQQRMTS